MASDFGMKVSQAGKDVQTAGDSGLLFSSSWPLLPIVKEGWVPALPISGEFRVPHDLGYTPAFLVFDMRSNQSQFNKTAVTLLNQYVNEKELLLVGNNVFATDENAFYYYILDIDIKEDYQAPSVDVGSSVEGGLGDVGIKTSLENRSTKSRSIHDFGLHSSTRSPMVHQVGHARTERDFRVSAYYYMYTFTHDLPYPPIYLAFVETDSAGTYDGYYTPARDNSDIPGLIVGGVVTGKQSITVEYIDSDIGPYGDRSVSTVIFKDPYNADEVQVVNYG